MRSRDDFREEGGEVVRACVGVQDAGAQRLAAAGRARKATMEVSGAAASCSTSGVGEDT